MKTLLIGLLLCAAPTFSYADALLDEVDKRAEAAETQVIEWRRDFHQNPELSNREVRTGRVVAEQLRAMGIEVQTEIAITGVVGVLEGGKPGPVVALRADMDGLPVTEQTGLPFASKAKGSYLGEEVGVMHACGHDTHIAILLGVAQVLSELRDQIPGTVKFIFQPAEEGAPPGEEGGADLMVAEGALENPDAEAIFALHSVPDFEVGQIAYKPAGMMAGSDRLRIVVHGEQTHGAKPWLGIDPIVLSSQIVLALQTIASRQIEVIRAPAIITVGTIHGGTRYNIIPDDVELRGTIRTFDAEMRKDIHRRIERTVLNIVESAGASAEVEISNGIPVTYNDPELTEKMGPVMKRAVGEENVVPTLAQTWAEDFAFFQQEIPGVYFLLGVRTRGADPADFPSNHSPRFMVDEESLVVGVKVLAHAAVGYLQMDAE